MSSTQQNPAALISADELAARLGEPNLVVVDCRFNLLQPHAGRRSWADGHIPGAFYADLDQDLADPVSPESGRHPLPSAARLARLFGSWGMTAHSEVVAYDDSGGAIAARLWWLLRWSGHAVVRLLDGGYSAWLAADLPVEVREPDLLAGDYAIRTGQWPVVTTAEIERRLGDEAFTLLDARDTRRFAGRTEPIDAKAGHIPGARNWPFSNNLAADGSFRAGPELAESFRALLGTAPGGQVAVMCGSGVTACHTLLAMELAGLFPDPRNKPALYCGSWSEWIRSDERPMATGKAD